MSQLLAELNRPRRWVGKKKKVILHFPLAKGAEITWAEPSAYRNGTDTPSAPPSLGCRSRKPPPSTRTLRASNFNASSWCSRGVDGAPPGRSVMATIL
ncbi:hypothetical protein OUZ56_007494 [Daphnia magna]|uniref:Uncharacterized protein n=1 Tax=Daphnia magna TaxID=35525 RepID=A0ABR0AA49_9CRUS|nr:hypothetical protein OUZ56_007494 [Daphnia magna]